MGDAVHKATINPGLGGNLAVEGVVHLLNPLVAALNKQRSDMDGQATDQRLTRQELHEVFARYEQDQRGRADKIVKLSGYVTRLEAMDTWWLRLLLRLMPWISTRAKVSMLVEYMKEADHLEFLSPPANSPCADKGT